LVTQGPRQADGWCIDAQQSRTVRLFEVPAPEVEQCLITYRAKMKSQDVTGRAFLEIRFSRLRITAAFRQPCLSLSPEREFNLEVILW